MSDPSRQDHEVVRRVLGGDRDAFAELVRAYQTRVRGYCRGMLRDAAEADDAAQEVFLKAYQGLSRFRGEASFSSWLYRIAANHCLDLLRRRGRRRAESLDALLEAEGEQALARLAPEDPPAPAEAGALAERLLAALPEEHRSLIVLREVQGLSYEELAQALRCSVDAVKGRLKRSRQILAREARHFLGQAGVQTGRGPR
jgi:RNA polymerase sigma-70 factor (ECF subfamily)